MRHLCCHILLLLACCAGPALGEEPSVFTQIPTRNGAGAGGTFENSPMLQHWVLRPQRVPRSEGTAGGAVVSFQPSLRDGRDNNNAPPNAEALGYLQDVPPGQHLICMFSGFGRPPTGVDTHGEEPIVVGNDGSVTCRFRCGGAAEQTQIFRFGLPRTAPAKLWREGEVLRGLWVTNGIRYTETVLLTSPASSATKPVGNSCSNLVLLINIQGENTNSEYAEAVAELVLETGNQQQALELKEGLVWCVKGSAKSLIGVLEIPQPGVKVSQGKALQFAGNMPPSEKGSMTLKVPLTPLENAAAAEWLQDLEFAAELHQALTPRKQTPPPGQRRLLFAPEDKVETCN